MMVVMVVGQQRVPVVTQVKLGVRFARVSLVDADQLIVTWILLKEAAYTRNQWRVSHENLWDASVEFAFRTFRKN